MPSEMQTRVARAIWSIRREDEDRCDMELEDMGRAHPVWAEALAVMKAMREPTEVMRAAAPLMPPSFYSAAIDAEIAAAGEPSHG